MKKIIFISICLFSLCLNLNCKETKIKLNDNTEKTVIIPDDIKELEKAYLDMSKLYLETKNDLNKSLNDNKKILEDLNSEIIIKDEYKKRTKELLALIDESQKSKIKLIRPIIWGGVDYLFNSKKVFGQDINFSIGIGIGLTIYERVNLSLLTSCPDFRIGLILGIYLTN